jgi:hypothetical protein
MPHGVRAHPPPAAAAAAAGRAVGGLRQLSSAAHVQDLKHSQLRSMQQEIEKSNGQQENEEQRVPPTPHCA